MQARLLGPQVRPVRGGLPSVPGLRAVSLRRPGYPAVPRLRGSLSMQGTRRRRILQSMQAWLLCPVARKSRGMLTLRLFRCIERLQRCQNQSHYGKTMFCKNV